MRVIIAGSRGIQDYSSLLMAIAACPFVPTVIISGGARGVDQLGERYAKSNNIPLEKYLANWNAYGKSAGYKRNVEMANVADALLVIWDGESKGTRHMMGIAHKKKLQIFIWTL